MSAWQSMLRLTPLLVLFGMACEAPVPTVPAVRLDQLEAIGIVQESLAARNAAVDGDCLGFHTRFGSEPFDATFVSNFRVNDEEVRPV